MLPDFHRYSRIFMNETIRGGINHRYHIAVVEASSFYDFYLFVEARGTFGTPKYAAYGCVLKDNRPKDVTDLKKIGKALQQGMPIEDQITRYNPWDGSTIRTGDKMYPDDELIDIQTMATAMNVWETAGIFGLPKRELKVLYKLLINIDDEEELGCILEEYNMIKKPLEGIQNLLP